MVIVSSIVDYLRRATAYHRTRRLLHEMDDRLLSDIGIRRDEIDIIAKCGLQGLHKPRTETPKTPKPGADYPKGKLGYV